MTIDLQSGPQLVRCVASSGVAYWTDVRLSEAGILVALSERGGGVSEPPFESLNLAAHVGDRGSAVDRNRQLLLESLGIERFAKQLVCAEQVHGSSAYHVGRADAGRGALAEHGEPPVPAVDALITSERGIPLMLFFADCVPIVLVAPGPCVAVVHSGWRGALGGIAGATARALAAAQGCATDEIDAYIGAHIGACHYRVDPDVMSHFVNTFGTFARAESGGLDLGAVVAASLVTAGVQHCRIASLGICTAEATDRFYSYRAEMGSTGRHGALAFVMPPPS